MLDSCLPLEFPSIEGKSLVCSFDGGEISSDAGFVLLRQADRVCGMSAAFSQSLSDQRDPRRIRHSRATMLCERIYAIAQGYEDANDLDTLGTDPALKSACDVLPRTGARLASQPTLSRFENSVGRRELIRAAEALARCVIAQLPADTKRIDLDVDITDDPCHGQQEFEFFNGFYDTHCFLPMLVYVTGTSRAGAPSAGVPGSDGRQWLLGALLRHGKAHSTRGLRWVLRRAVRLIRERFPAAQIVLRGDCGFGYNTVLRMCDALGIDFVLGVARNRRLQVLSTATQMDACIKYTQIKGSSKGEVLGCREFGEFLYKADTWAKKERVIIKAEITRGELNPRFVVTSLTEDAEQVYQYYCARGDRENRIKEFKLDLLSGRTSCHRFAANQFRLLLHLGASILMSVLQKAVQGTCWAKAQVSTLRLRLLKVGARIVESVRRVHWSLPSSFPERDTWRHIHECLTR
jgi:hypothetical protein